MMKKQFLFFALLCFSFAFGQKEIQVTKNSTVLLVFPEPVANHTIGNLYEYIVYENNRKDAISRKIIRLGYNIKGRGNSRTNLSVVTEDGLLYEFILSYTDSIPKLTHQVLKSEASVNLSGDKTNESVREPERVMVEGEGDQEIEIVQTPESSYTEGTQTKFFDIEKMAGIDPATMVSNELYINNKEAYIYLQSKNTQFRKKRIARTFDRAYNVTLRLKSVNYDKDELYLYLTLENNGAQAYDVDFIKFAVTTVRKGNRTDQEPPHLPPYIFKIPKRIEGDIDQHFVVIFDKFPLSKYKQLWIEVREKNGTRNLILKIDHRIINNPNKF